MTLEEQILSLSLSTNMFPGEFVLSGFIVAKDNGSGDDSWSYKTCKAPVKSSPATMITQLLRALPVTQSTHSDNS